jgi:hypothetical protein
MLSDSLSNSADPIDNSTTATHATTSSSPSSASTVPTPPDFSAVQHAGMIQQQHQQFAKQLEGACFSLDVDAQSVARSMHSFHSHAHAGAGFEMVPNDPFGLDASLFSV